MIELFRKLSGNWWVVCGLLSSFACSTVYANPLGAELFARHCAACHGEKGDGLGLAADYLFPRPRDFRKGRFRLVSTKNNVPTREDLHAVLLRGMPGSSMPSWAHLTQAERDALVDEVMSIRREGARQSYIQSLKELDGLTDEEIAEADVQQEIDDHAEEFSTPGESVDVPSIASATAEQIASGQAIYTKTGCISCHGATGKGDGVQAMVDDDNLPTSPRDFTLGIFKGNHDPSSLYRRIAYGMPGTPMPGSSMLTSDQMVNLVHYIRSLSTEQQREAAAIKRHRISATRVSRLPKTELPRDWASIKAVKLGVFPLWWRTDSNPDLMVQAVHNGKSLAIRLSWKDPTPNEQAAQSQSFEDGAAIQLYRGDAEPFLGMGSRDAPVDVWYWDADRQRSDNAVASSYPRAVNDWLPLSERAATSADLNRPAAALGKQPSVLFPARATGNQIASTGQGLGGSSLHVGGPGTMTFRLPLSQVVQARGTWADGVWSVIMHRELATKADDSGISLRPGDRVSAAFALWDGHYRDRDGQKLVTIWQDLVLEK